MLVRGKVKIPSLSGECERTCYVRLPNGYSPDADVRYPVIYMFDGHNLFSDEEAAFGKCWGLDEYIEKSGTQVIIAAVECNHLGDSRLSEYSPVSFAYHGKRIVGRGKKYMDWLTGEFKSFIDGEYPTLPDRENTFIAGSSMGGLMTLYALAKYPKIFGGGAALSPSLWVEEKLIPSFIYSGKFGINCKLFMDYGEKEFAKNPKSRERFFEAAKTLSERGVALTARVNPDGGHDEQSWCKEIPFFMAVLGLNPLICGK